MAMRDLRVYAEAAFGSVSHYLDKNGLECDAVVHLRNNGTYGLVEIKLGGESLVEEGAATLNGLAKIVDTSRMKAPAFKMDAVIVSSMLPPLTGKMEQTLREHGFENKTYIDMPPSATGKIKSFLANIFYAHGYPSFTIWSRSPLK